MQYTQISDMLRKLRRRLNPELARREKLDSLFKEGNTVVHVPTGEQCDVQEVRLGSAMMTDTKGLPFVLDWIGPAGQIRTHVANDWQLKPR